MKKLLLSAISILLFLSLANIGLATTITDCYNLSANNTVYTLTNDIINSNATKCMNITGFNSILDCQGNQISGHHTAGTHGIWINLSTPQSLNFTIQNCNITNWSYDINCNNNGNNISLINITATASLNGPQIGASGSTCNNTIVNNFTTDGILTFNGDTYNIYNLFGGLSLSGATNANVTEGSIYSTGGSYDYSVNDATNNFTNTNFTVMRRIKFNSGTNYWFKYRNDTSNLWTLTSIISASRTLTRILNNNSQYNVSFNDNLTSSTATGNYTIWGLLPYTQYRIYNYSILAYTLTTDGNGNLPYFTIPLNTTTEEIKVNTTTADTTPPQILSCLSDTTNNTVVNVGNAINIACQWVDNVALSKYVNSSQINQTGSWTNGTWSAFTSGWSNFTIIMPSSSNGGNYSFKIYANDTSGNANVSQNYFWVTSDTTPPQYSLNSTNSTYAGSYVMHSLYWIDNTILSGYIFSTNNTGIWINSSWQPMNGGTNWSNYTNISNTTVGALISWQVFANDTSNNWNASQIFNYVTINPISYSNTVISNTYRNATANFSITYSTYSNFKPNGCWIFSTNNTGTWTNTSCTSFTSSSSQTLSNAIILNSTLGKVVGYRWYINDTYGIRNDTPINYLITDNGYPRLLSISDTPDDTFHGRKIVRDATGRLHFLVWNDTGIYYTNDTIKGIFNLQYIGNPLGGNGGYSSIAIDSTGRLHVAYASSGNTLSYLNSSDYVHWGNNQVLNTSNNLCGDISMAVDSNDALHLVCDLTTSPYTIIYMNTSDYVHWSNWIPIMGGVRHDGTSLAIDSNNNLYVVSSATYGGPTPYWIDYINRTNGVWGTIVNITPGVVAHIAVDNNNNLQMVTTGPEYWNSTNKVNWNNLMNWSCGSGGVRPIIDMTYYNTIEILSDCIYTGQTYSSLLFSNSTNGVTWSNYTLDGGDSNGYDAAFPTSLWSEFPSFNKNFLITPYIYYKNGQLWYNSIGSTTDPSIIHLALNSTENNHTYIFPQIVNATGWLEIPSNGIGNLYRNGVLTENLYKWTVFNSNIYEKNSTLFINKSLLNAYMYNLNSYPENANNLTFRIRLTNSSFTGDLKLGFNATGIGSYAYIFYNGGGNFYGAYNGGQCGTGTISDTNWHTFGINMENGFIVFYLDGSMFCNDYQPNAANTIFIYNNMSTTDLLVDWVQINGTAIEDFSNNNNEIIQLPVGVYNYSFNYSGNAYYNSSEVWYLANVTQGTLTGSISGNNVTYPTSVNVIPSKTDVGDTDVNYTFWRNNTLVSSANGTAPNADTSQLAVGSYVYVLNSTGGNNWSSNAGISTMVITVSKATTTVYLWLNQTQGNKNYNRYQIANLTAQSSIAGLTVNISTNITGWNEPTGTTSIVNLTNLTTIGIFNITAYTLGNANQSSSSITYYATVGSGDSPPSSSNIQTSNPSSYSATKTWMNVTWTDTDATPVSKVIISSDYSGAYVNYTAYNVSNVYFWNQTLPAGTWHWLSYANDTANQWSITGVQTFTINQVSPSITLVTNTSSWTVTYPTPTNITGDACPSQLTCTLYRNGNIIWPQDDNQLFAVGNYNYTYYTAGNQNYTTQTIQHTLIVLTSEVSPGGLTLTYNQTKNNVGLSIFNETFTTPGDKIFYVNIPKNSTVTNAKLNVSGYQNYITIQDNPAMGTSTSNMWQKINTTFVPLTINNISTWIGCGLPGCGVSASMVIQDETGNTNLSSVITQNVGYGSQNSPTNFGNFNYNLNLTLNYRVMIYTNTTTSIIYDAANPWGLTSSLGSTADLGLIIYGLSPYPTNPYLDIANDGDTQWNYSGSYSDNQQTSDFSTEVNQYLKSCSPYVDGTCDVPITIHSDSVGIMQISNMNVSYDTQTYDSSVYEGQNSLFYIKVNSTADITDVNGTLIWNGVSYPADSKTQTGTYWTFNKLLTIPSSPSTVNFYWNFNYTNATGTYNQYFASQSQSVSSYALTSCTGGNVTLNLTAFDEETQALKNFNMDINLTYGQTQNILNKNFNYSFTGNNTYQICLNPSTNVYANAVIRYWNDSTLPRYYYLDNLLLNTTMQNINLYLPNSTYFRTTLTIVNSYSQLISDATIYVQRNYNASYQTIAEGKTTSTGVFTFDLNPNIIYSLIITSDQGTRTTTLQPTSSSFSILIPSEGMTLPSYWEAFNGWTDTCSFDNTTPKITCSWSDVSGHLINVRMKVNSLSGDTTICDNTTTMTNGTLVCVLPTISNVTYAMSLFTKHGSESESFIQVDSLLLTFYKYFAWGVLGIFLTLIITMTMGFFALQIGRPTFIVFSTIISIVFCFLMGFISPLESIGGAILGLIFAAIIIMMKSGG